jgi:hypothetical protein
MKKIKEINGKQFLIDINSVTTIMVYTSSSNSYLKVRKNEVLKSAETQKIYYYFDDSIFVIPRKVMVIL